MSLVPFGFWAASGAGGGAGAYDLLETVTLTSSASSVTFSGLGSYSDYAHLQVRAVGQSTVTGNGVVNVMARINSDTGSNYALHDLYCFNNQYNSFVTSTGYGSQTKMIARNVLTSSSSSYQVGCFIMDFLDFSSTSKTKTMRVLGGATQSGQSTVILSSGLWNDTAAVTTILIYVASNFAAGSRFSIYGIRG